MLGYMHFVSQKGYFDIIMVFVKLICWFWNNLFYKKRYINKGDLIFCKKTTQFSRLTVLLHLKSLYMQVHIKILSVIKKNECNTFALLDFYRWAPCGHVTGIISSDWLISRCRCPRCWTLARGLTSARIWRSKL